MKCVVCGKDNWRKKFNRLDTDFVVCINCGLIRIDPIPSDEKISDYYVAKSASGNYDLNYALSQQHDADYRYVYNQFLNLTKLYSRHPRRQKLLDIGCFVGLFLDKAQQYNFLTYGVEYQPEAAKIANEKHDGRVYCGPIESYPTHSSGSFDVITLFGVIEHVTAPDRALQITAKLLKQGGIIIIQTPNTASILARVFGKWWPAYVPIEHIHYFSSRNIKILLERNGFNTIKLISHWKKLPVGYIYKQFQNFAPECYKILNKLIPFVPNNVLNWKLPFYGGEMLLVAKKI